MELALEAAATDPTLADPHFALGSAYGLLGRLEQSRQSFLRALELDPNHAASMNNLSVTYSLAGQLDESLYWTRRSWPLSAKAPNDFYHVTVPLLSMRDDELTRRWLAEAERQPDHSRTEITLSHLQVYLGDSAAGLARARAAVERYPGNQEVVIVRNDFAILAGADDAEPLNEAEFRSAPDVPGIVLPESARLRYAFLLQQRGDARARALIEEAESRARGRIAGGDLGYTTFMDVAVARAASGRLEGRACRAATRLRQRLARLRHRRRSIRCSRRSVTIPAFVRCSIAPGATSRPSENAREHAACWIWRR